MGRNIVVFPAVETFDTGCTYRQQAEKISCEAMEVFAEAQKLAGDMDTDMDASEYRRVRDAMLSECADVIQAVANLLSMAGVDNAGQIMYDCYRRNKARGRYGREVSHDTES